jgi:hypothetical protein
MGLRRGLRADWTGSSASRVKRRVIGVGAVAPGRDSALTLLTGLELVSVRDIVGPGQPSPSAVARGSRLSADAWLGTAWAHMRMSAQKALDMSCD